jgi:hypothetical protein
MKPYEDLAKSFNALITYLENSVTTEGFAERTFYGEAYAACCFEQQNKQLLVQKSLQGFAHKHAQHEAARDHHEFHLYALYRLKDKKLVENYLSLNFPRPLKEKPTNWILLRTLAYLHYGTHWQRLLWIIISCLTLMFNQRNGLFLDRRIGRILLGDTREDYQSHQYHAFILVLLSNLYDVTGLSWYANWFSKGIHYLKNQILENGKIVPKGRGQDQLFGYANTLYALAWDYRQHGSKESLHALERVVHYLQGFQKSDGSFPLVLCKHDDKSNWETYNNLFDYLPFTALMMQESINLLQTDKKNKQTTLPLSEELQADMH